MLSVLKTLLQKLDYFSPDFERLVINVVDNRVQYVEVVIVQNLETA